jgi:hypothetical protein
MLCQKCICLVVIALASALDLAKATAHSVAGRYAAALVHRSRFCLAAQDPAGSHLSCLFAVLILVLRHIPTWGRSWQLVYRPCQRVHLACTSHSLRISCTSQQSTMYYALIAAVRSTKQAYRGLQDQCIHCKVCFAHRPAAVDHWPQLVQTALRLFAWTLGQLVCAV